MSAKWENDIGAFLAACAPLQAVLSGGSITWDLAPSNPAGSYIVFSTVHTQGETTLTGPSGIDFVHLQATCWSSVRNVARDIRSALRTALEGVKIPGESQSVATFRDEHNIYDSATRLFGAILELQISTNP